MRPSSKLFALSLAVVSRAVAADPPRYALPVPLESRPFLLVDAPRRFLPTEPASVRVQRQGGGSLEVAVFRIRTIAAFVASPWPSQGVSVAALPLGRETEGLLARSAPLPRRGSNVDLVGLRRVTVRVRPPVRRAVGNETAAYDSNETDEGSVETYGVHSGDWADEPVSLGALLAGVYLVRVNAGGWSSSAVVSVGHLTLLARRGDARDVLTVTDGEGSPQPGVTVQRFVDGAPGDRAVTDANGRAELPAADALTARYVAVRGDDVAWADVTHARLPACDARVYVAAGRPVYRPREVAHLRGHARGCVDGRDVPLADEPVEIRNGDDAAIVRTRTDRDGNFLADLPAADEITARVRGRDHRRTLHIDGRPLPRRALRLRFDRPWAAAGESVSATLSDDQGGWPTPAMATFRTPVGLMTSAITPGHPATVTFMMPPTEEALTRVTVRADVPDGAAVTYAEADLWTGATRDVLELASERTNGTSGQPFPLRLLARDLGGREHSARATLRVYGTDGNHRLGAARSEQTVDLPRAASVRLDGAGPWWIEAAASGDTSARTTSLVVWERARPPSLSSRGELAVAVPDEAARPGSALTVSLRAPALGNTLVTLEQGGLWSSRIVTPAQSGAVQLPVPEGARGAATVVATHVHGGQVNHATVAVEVETSRKLRLTARTDQRSYNASSTARVTVRARNTDGTPRDAVVSLWVADAGWWEIAEENHPSPNDWFRLPGRPASAGDSTRPRAFGAEEGRHFDPALEWNGRPLRGTTFRHTWTSTAPLVNFDSEGSFGTVANGLARAAGFARAEVCASANQAAGAVRVRARQIPWDLAAVRFAERTDTGAEVVGDVLHFDCGVSGAGYGSGAGRGLGGRGSGGTSVRGNSPTQTMDGTIFFLGLRRLGPTGEATIDVPLPERAGRWRVEAIAIADDGAGESAHAEFVSTRALVAQVELPPSLAAGDVAEGAVTVEASGLAGREVTVSLDGGEGLRLPSFAPRTIALDAHGLARVPFTVRAERAGAWTLAATVQAPGGATERAELPVTVRSDPANEPVDLDTAVGPGETDVELRVPALASPASLEFRVEIGVDTGVRAVVASMRDPSWNAPSILLERLRTWAALRAALATPGVPRHDDLHAAVTHGRRGAAEAVRERMGLTSGVSWWRGLRSDPTLTALVLDLLFDELTADDRRGAREVLRAALPTTQRPLVLAQIAAALSHDEDAATRALARTALDRALSSDAGADALAVYERALAAAKTLGDAPRATSAAARLAAAVDRTLANDSSARCRGAAWFVCLRGDGDRARVARAARALALHDAAQLARAASALAWITRHPVRRDGPWWGQDEAAVVALQAVFPSDVVGGAVAVRLDGREIGRVGGGASGTWLQVPGEGTLTVSFPRQAGRAARLRVRGELPTAPRATAVGTAPFARRIERAGNDVALVMEFTLATAGRDVELHAPLPAQWVPAGRAGANDARVSGGRRADRWGFDLSGWDWYALDRTPTNQSPRVDYADGAVRVRYGALLPGRHVVRVPLAEVARGTFRAGAAWLRADGGRVWALTPPLGP